jgi:peptidoglycan/LPS O-acetylase OafA/YrhL
MKARSIHFAGLNGLRALAALSVVISHITLSLGKFHLDPKIFGTFKDGSPKGLLMAGYGVTIFFVLSGFLITYLLQAEKEAGEIDIKKFYVRRVLRIWPLYYAYFAVAVIILRIFDIHTDWGTWPYYIFLAANIPFIMKSGINSVEHYWSLGVEEQFYLFWPWVNKKLDKGLVPFACTLIVVFIGAKLALNIFWPNSVFETAIHVTASTA